MKPILGFGVWTTFNTLGIPWVSTTMGSPREAQIMQMMGSSNRKEIIATNTLYLINRSNRFRPVFRLLKKLALFRNKETTTLLSRRMFISMWGRCQDSTLCCVPSSWRPRTKVKVQMTHLNWHSYLQWVSVLWWPKGVWKHPPLSTPNRQKFGSKPDSCIQHLTYWSEQKLLKREKLLGELTRKVFHIQRKFLTTTRMNNNFSEIFLTSFSHIQFLSIKWQLKILFGNNLLICLFFKILFHQPNKYVSFSIYRMWSLTLLTVSTMFFENLLKFKIRMWEYIQVFVELVIKLQEGQRDSFQAKTLWFLF